LEDKLHKFEGNLIQKSNFGFVGDVFIPPYLLEKNAIANAPLCTGIAVAKNNEKTHKTGWVAVYIDTNDNS
jgi:hypothetical protein